MADAVLDIEGLYTHFPACGGTVRAVDGVSLQVGAGETVGVVGESGCGKTTLALSVLRLVPEPGRIVSGRISVDGQDVVDMDVESLRRLRGRGVAMTFQDPMTALNPLKRVGAQIAEAITAHGPLSPEVERDRAVELLDRVGIADPARRVRHFPHQLSAGMRQRVLLAMAVANKPRILLADEPTSALDATNQAGVIELMARLNSDLGTAILLITHNMAVVTRLCRRVVVMYAGRVVEEGSVCQVFEHPQHPYTWSLLRSAPAAVGPSARLMSVAGAPPDLAHPPPGCRFHPRCPFREDRCQHEEPPLEEVEPGQQVRCWVLMRNTSSASAGPQVRRLLQVGPSTEAPTRREPVLRVEEVSKHFAAALNGGEVVRAVDGVSLVVNHGETLGLVGESGAGKSTLARLITGLIPATAGRVVFEGQDLTELTGRRLRSVRCRIQIVFQDPFSSLDPRMTVGRSVAEPLDNFRLAEGAQRQGRLRSLLEVVGLDPETASRYPHELSGGQRQRVGIARALAPDPALIVCDEPVSSLDVSIQAQILNLLMDLQHQFALAYVFISHDLDVIRHISHRVAVMHDGRIVETAAAADLYHSPRHPYTQRLLTSVPDRLPGGGAGGRPERPGR